MSQVLFLPIIVPLAAAIVLLLATGHVRAQRVVSGASTLIALVASVYLFVVVWEQGIQVYRLGNWPLPFGIVLVGDLLSAVMVVMSFTVGAAALFFSMVTLDAERERYFHPLFQFQLVGVSGSFLTGDIFNLFVFFEVMLISSYALLSLGGERLQLEASVKYVGINLLSSTLLLSTIGLLYGLMGTLNMADLAQKVALSPDKGLITVLAMLFMVVFGVKAAVFPLHFWLPGAYTVIPSGIAAYFGGVLTKVGIYALLRVFTLIFNYDPGFTHTILLVIGGVTMLAGVLGATGQKSLRGILSYHIISQIGYIVMGLGIFTVLSIAGSLFFTVHNMVVKSSLFLVAGATEKLSGSGQLKDLGGMARTHPYLGLLFLVAALSLAGFPPFSGFFGKVVLFKAGLEAQSYLVIGIAVVVSLLTLFSMMKIWNGAFWGEAKGPYERSYAHLVPSIAFLVLLSAGMGLAFQPLLTISMRTAEQMMNPAMYIQAVMGAGG